MPPSALRGDIKYTLRYDQRDLLLEILASFQLAPAAGEVFFLGHGGDELFLNLDGLCGTVSQQVDGGAGHNLGGCNNGQIGTGDLVICAVAYASCAADAHMNDRHDIGDVGSVGGTAGAVAVAVLFAEDILEVVVDGVLQLFALKGAHVAGQVDDLALGAQCHGAGLQGTVDLLGGFEDGFGVAAADIGLEADVVGNDIDQIAALGDDGMDTDGVLITEGLTVGVDGGQTQLCGLE